MIELQLHYKSTQKHNHNTIRMNYRFVILLLLLLGTVYSYNNGLARTPPMGFNTWNQFECSVNETVIRQTIDTMVLLGLRDLGYIYVNIDDCWALRNRDPITKRMVADPQKFPSGILALSRYAHSKGMKLGIYSDLGTLTCQGYPGSSGYYELDAQTFAEWELDYLKLDFCSTSDQQHEQPWLDYGEMSKQLNSTGRPILFSICNWGVNDPWKWAPKIANLWRTTGDIDSTWESVMTLVDQNKKLFPFAGPHNWNDPDMLEVGVIHKGRKLSRVQARSHFTIWSMLAAPLILGNDMTSVERVEPWILDIIANPLVIQVNQDGLGLQAVVAQETVIGVINDKCTVDQCRRSEIWMRPLVGDAFAVMLFNRGGLDPTDSHFSSERFTVDWEKHLKVRDPMTPFSIRNLWTGQHYGVFRQQFEYGSMVPVQDVVLLKFTRVNSL